MRLLGWQLAAIAGVTLCAGASAQSNPSPPLKPEQNRAFAEAVAPDGVGGCVYRAIGFEARQEALMFYLSGKTGLPPGLPAAVAATAPRCGRRGDTNNDLPLLASVLGTFRRTSSAITFASRFGVGQRSLDAAWSASPEEAKLPYLAVADEFLDPTRGVTPPAGPLPTAMFARHLGLSADTEAKTRGLLHGYYVATALKERGEARMAPALGT